MIFRSTREGPKWHVAHFNSLNNIHVIECLKKTGLEIKDIKQFIQWCSEGSSTYTKRRELFEEQKKILEKKKEELEKNMAMIQYKCWYYDQAIKDGSEENISKIIPNSLPPEIQLLYDQAHNIMNEK